MDAGQILEQARDALTVRRVFGEPIQRDGVLVVPVAKLMGGAGSGSGEEGAGPAWPLPRGGIDHLVVHRRGQSAARRLPQDVEGPESSRQPNQPLVVTDEGARVRPGRRREVEGLAEPCDGPAPARVTRSR